MQSASYRIIFFHQVATGTEPRFLLFSERQSALGFENLSEDATLLQSLNELPEPWLDDNRLETLAQMQENMQAGGLNVEFVPDFLHGVAIPDGDSVAVLLGRFTESKPPLDVAQRLGAEFQNTPAFQGIAPVERDLMQKAYQMLGF